MNNNPIGVLDSGVGGLTVWKEIISLLPNESTIYLGDSRNAPYGDRTPEDIHQLSRHLIQFLLRKEVKIIVIACNTITTTCLDRLRNEFKQVPIIGTVPVVKKAVEETKTKKIGILSTNNTANSYYQRHLIEQFGDGTEVVNKGTNELVPLIEKGEVSGERIEKILQKVLKPFLEKHVDIMALGCTHFPFVSVEMKKILGQEIKLLDSGSAIARQVKRVLENNNALSEKKKEVHDLYTTGDRGLFEKIVGYLKNKDELKIHSLRQA